MRFNMKSIIFFLTLLLLIFLGSIDAYPESVRGVTNTTIKIGVIMDITGPTSGDIGHPLTAAFRNYAKYINDNGGIFGRKAKLVVEDDRYSIPAAIAGFKKLVFKDQVFALIGPGSSGGNRVLFKQFAKHRVPNMSVAPAKEVVRPLKKYVFLSVNLYDDHLGVIFDYILNELKPEKPKITFVYFDAESGRSALESMKKWAEYFNFEFDTEIISMGALDATSQAMNIRRKKSTIVAIHHTSPATAALLRDLRRYGLDIPVFGTAIAIKGDTVKIARTASRNSFGALPFITWNEDTEGSVKMKEISSQAENKYCNGIYIIGWVASINLYEGLKRAGRDLSIEKLITGLESIRNFDTGGLCGPVNFSPTDHQGIYHSKLYKADPENGRVVPITDWRLPPEIK